MVTKVNLVPTTSHKSFWLQKKIYLRQQTVSSFVKSSVETIFKRQNYGNEGVIA